MLRRAFTLFTVVALAVTLLGAAPAEAATVLFEEIEPPTPATSISANDLNEAGAVTGTATFGSDRRAYLRSAAGALTDLGVLGTGYGSFGSALNEAGAVVGSSATTVGGDFRGFLWTEGGGMVDLGLLDVGDGESAAVDVNDSGWIVGRSGSKGWVRDPADGSLVDVGTVPGATVIQMTAINDAGLAVGAAFVPGDVVAFTWTEAGGIEALPLPVGVTSFRPSAVNDAGQVLGTDFDLVTGYRTWLWDPIVGFTELTGPAGFPSVIGSDLNERGVVVGTAEDAVGDRSLAVWDTVRSATASVFPPPVADTIDATIGVVTDSGAMIADTNEIVEDDDFGRSFLGQLALGPDPVSMVAQTTCDGVLDMGWSAPAFAGYAPVTYVVQADGVTLAEVSSTSYRGPAPDPGSSPSGPSYTVIARTVGGDAAPQPVSIAGICLPPSTTTTTTPTGARPATSVAAEPTFAG